MTIDIERTASQTILRITGRLDTITAPALDKTIQQDLVGADSLVLDMAGLEYISSAGLRVLLNAQKKQQKAGGMKLISVRDEVMEVLEMTGFADILEIE